MLTDRDTSLGFLSSAFFSGLLSSAAALLSFLGGRGETSSTFFFVFSDSLSLSFVGSTFPTTVNLFSAISVFTSSTPEKEESITNVVSVQRNLKIVKGSFGKGQNIKKIKKNKFWSFKSILRKKTVSRFDFVKSD